MEWKCSHPIEKLFIFLWQIPIAKEVNLNVCEPKFICRQELKSLSIGSHILEETHMPDPSDSISISSPFAFPFQSQGLLGVPSPFLATVASS